LKRGAALQLDEKLKQYARAEGVDAPGQMCETLARKP
jgi:hypothetical protein